MAGSVNAQQARFRRLGQAFDVLGADQIERPASASLGRMRHLNDADAANLELAARWPVAAGP